MNGFGWPVRVYYEDTDAGGVVYYANYLRFLERARTEWLRALGFEQDALARDAGVIFAVRRVEVDYLKPARFNDALTVHARIAERGRASLVFAQEVIALGRPTVVALNMIDLTERDGLTIDSTFPTGTRMANTGAMRLSTHIHPLHINLKSLRAGAHETVAHPPAETATEAEQMDGFQHTALAGAVFTD